MYKYKTITITSLLLDPDNYRYPEAVDSQRDAIKKMVSIEGDKIVKLAEDIIEYSLDPSERALVRKTDDDEGYVVVEGNRRLTALKLLNQPDLIGENATTRKIKKLLRSDPQVPTELDCAVFDNYEEYKHWVDLKHTGENEGRGRVRWSGHAVDRKKAANGDESFTRQFMIYVEKEPLFDAELKANAMDLRPTNVERLFSTPYVRECLGLVPLDGVLYSNVSRGKSCEIFTKLLLCMLEKNEFGKYIFTVDEIRYRKDRIELMDQLGLQQLEQEVESQWKLTDPASFKDESTGESTSNDSNDGTGEGDQEGDDGNSDAGDDTEDGGDQNSNSTNLSPDRPKLVPRDFGLKISEVSDPKCKQIYTELKQRLNFDKHQIAIPILFRTFIDLSLECYMSKNGVSAKKGQKNGMHDKVILVADDLVSKNKLEQNQRNTVVQCSSSALTKNGHLNSVVHNLTTYPSRSTTNEIWNNMQFLLLAVWK